MQRLNESVEPIMILSTTMELLSVDTVIYLRHDNLPGSWIRVKRTRAKESGLDRKSQTQARLPVHFRLVLMKSVPVPFSVNSYFVSVYGLNKGWTYWTVHGRLKSLCWIPARYSDLLVPYLKRSVLWISLSKTISFFEILDLNFWKFSFGFAVLI